MEWIMFDADNTLLDFDSASKEALWLTFEGLNIQCSEEIYKVYKKINAQVWADFEAEKITAVELRSLRFSRLFDTLDYQPCSGLKFNTSYLNNLIKASQMYDGVENILNELKGEYKLSIITNGLKEVQRPRLDRLGLTKYFDSIVVSDEVGVAKPHIRYFEHSYKSIPNPPQIDKIMVVGDNLKSDIIGGNNFGANTCWVSHGKMNDTDIEPHYTITTIHDFISVL